MVNMIGQSIGRYHIIERLGEGGMAEVFRAFDKNLECDVAIKFIRTQKLTRKTQPRHYTALGMKRRRPHGWRIRTLFRSPTMATSRGCLSW